MANLTITRGTTYSRTVNYSVNGVPTSLIGSTVRFTIKTTEFDEDDTDSAAVLIKNVTNGTIGGVAVITINPLDTQNIVPGNYFYDIKVDTLSTGATIYLMDSGKIKLVGTPTNRLS